MERAANGESNKWREQQMERATNGESSKWKEQQMERATNGESNKWREQQMERAANGKSNKWREQQMERATNGENSKWKEQQMERAANGKSSKWKEQQMERAANGKSNKWREDGTRIKKIRNVSENDMIHKHKNLKYPYFKMKKMGSYSEIRKNNNFLFNRDIEIVYDPRYTSVFVKLKDIISLNLKGLTIREKCSEGLSFEIYDCLQNKILIMRKNEDIEAEEIFKEMLDKLLQSG
ncbi:conserved Plasmodium protein, unknown function [Plasmodium malariae]|uniref:Uncharacterized protein n=1 Tax=Plasmodium malariae TaxID=5858 RepID=A0A1D3SN83_PLAMA|nr:conserved Plasmodium protein, unknown function [Plasmodium malariae]SCO93294.1 conserved Plasmodium protein, unknown function [Plasmodium malariae]